MLRRWAIALVLLVSLSLLCLPVSAETGANSVNIYATVSSDGSCQVTATVLLHLEQAVGELHFPVPADAESITLNGSRVHAVKSAGARQVDLSGIAGNLVGEFSVTITYILKDLVTYDENEVLQLQLPLLSGFDYTVQQLEYAVTMPGEVGQKPAFSSGYHMSNIEKDLTSTVSGNVFSGRSNKPLKDHETLMMTVPVSEEMFPQKGIELPDFEATNTLTWVSFGLMILYFILFLRSPIPRRSATTAAPEGLTAGQLGAVLLMEGADLTQMVFTWAQLGYLRIVRGKADRILLQKQMDMGNERSGFEQRCFGSLFGRRGVVDTSELRYVELTEKTAKMNPGSSQFFKPHPGSKKIFRALAALIGLFGGAGIGVAVGTGAALHWLLVVLFSVIGFVLSLLIQRWSRCLWLGQKKPLWIALGAAGVLLLLGIIGGVFSIGFWTVMAQLLAGFLVALGGRRTPAGVQIQSEILGLRRYLRKVSREELERICRSNPEYFFTMAPYALALGVDKHFAKRFGKLQLPDCPYMELGTKVPTTAAGWSERFRLVAQAMDRRRKKMWLERLMGVVNGVKK